VSIFFFFFFFFSALAGANECAAGMSANLLVALFRTDGVMPNSSARASATVSVSDEAKKKKKKRSDERDNGVVCGLQGVGFSVSFVISFICKCILMQFIPFSWFGSNARHGQSQVSDAGARGVVADVCIAFTTIDNTYRHVETARRRRQVQV
jgi:hypothetical protein